MIGLIGIKEGMTQCFSEDGSLLPITVIKVDKNLVVNHKVKDRDSYSSVVLGAFDLKKEKAAKPYQGQFNEGMSLKKHLKEFRVDDPAKYEIGKEVGLEIFDGVKYVDVSGISKGKGFQGVVKRHGFHGGRATHGSKFHRQNGSTGQSAYPSRVLKGLKRAGRMGSDKVTVQSLKVVDIDNEKNLIFLKGCVPGNRKSIVYLSKAVKKS